MHGLLGAGPIFRQSVWESGILSIISEKPSSIIILHLKGLVGDNVIQKFLLIS